MDQWVDSYLSELKFYRDYLADKEISTIFIGGGTPSAADPYVFEKLLNYIHRYCNVAEDLEVTMEANPTSIEANKFKDFKAAGINRVSIGVQSLREDRLKFLGREHSAHQAIKALEVARQNFDRISIDLIYATPNQSLEEWRVELEQALDFELEHLSLYQLTIEKGTPFFADERAGKFVMPHEELAADSYNLTNQLCEARGLYRYEVSNYAVKGQECRHNLAYWNYSDYIGIGPGAHGRITINGSKVATMKIHSPSAWLKMVAEKGVGMQSETILTAPEIANERLLMCMRKANGMPLMLVPNQSKIQELIELKLVVVEGENLRTTTTGFLVLNSIIKYLSI